MIPGELEEPILKVQLRLSFLIGVLQRVQGGLDPSEVEGLVSNLQDLQVLVTLIKTAAGGLS